MACFYHGQGAHQSAVQRNVSFDGFLATLVHELVFKDSGNFDFDRKF